MNHDVLALNQRNLRGTDSNSLLRLYDQANDISMQSQSQLERARAGKIIERIALELEKRHVSLGRDIQRATVRRQPQSALPEYR